MMAMEQKAGKPLQKQEKSSRGQNGGISEKMRLSIESRFASFEHVK